MPLFWIPWAILFAVAAVFTLLLFSPVVAVVDTAGGRVRIRWSFLIAYTRPLPGTKGKPRLSIAGISIPLQRHKREPARKKKEKPAAERVEAKRRRQRKQARLLWNCLLDDDIRAALMRRFARLPGGLWEAVEVSRWHCNVSLPDPALNGMLWGAMAAVDWGPRTGLECNFTGRSELRTEVRLYPHRVLKTFLLFFLQLPYRAIFQRWRAS